MHLPGKVVRQPNAERIVFASCPQVPVARVLCFMGSNVTARLARVFDVLPPGSDVQTWRTISPHRSVFTKKKGIAGAEWLAAHFRVAVPARAPTADPSMALGLFVGLERERRARKPESAHLLSQRCWGASVDARKVTRWPRSVFWRFSFSFSIFKAYWYGRILS